LLSDINTLSRLIGALEMTCSVLADEELIDTQADVLAEDAIETSAIEGEVLRRSSARASIRKQLGLPVEQDDSDIRTDSLVSMLIDARIHAQRPLTENVVKSLPAVIYLT
jgi:hypothetical protein